MLQVKKTEAKSGARQLGLICETMKEAEDGWRDAYWLDSVSLGHTKAGKEVTSLVPRRAPRAERTVLGNRREVPWSDVWETVRDIADSEDLSKGASKPRVTVEAATHLGARSADVDLGNGRTAKVHMVKDNNTWKVRQVVIEAGPNATNWPDLDVLA